MSSLIVGTRTSALALWQTNFVINQLRSAWPDLDCQIKPFVTQGDKTQAQNKPLPEIGGKGLFTLELEEALRKGEIDLAIHSLKDLPVEDAPGLTLGAIGCREDVRDGLVARNGWTLTTLPPGAVIGTSSTRRTAQLLAARPDLTIKPIRGNVDTRIRKVTSGDYDATVLAAAGLRRLGLADVVTEWLSLETMLPAPGQGALAVQCRADDEQVLNFLTVVNDPMVRAAVMAERIFLNSLGGGCSAPVAAYAQPTGASDQLRMQALVASPDGCQTIRVEGIGESIELGKRLAQQTLERGADRILHLATASFTERSALSHSRFPDQISYQISNLHSPISQPLADKRIVITRAREQAEELAHQLAELGATPLIIPAIRIVPLPDLRPLDQAIQRLSAYDWLIFTSVNGLQIFADRLQAVHQSQMALHSVRVAAVGPATAAAVRSLGAEVAFMPEEAVAEAIAAGVGEVNGKRILLPQAAIARPRLAEQLTSQGACVDAIPVYQTLPTEISPHNLAELERGVDAVIFTSGSTVRNFMNALQSHPTLDQQVRQSLIVCIGPVTAQAAQEFHIAHPVVAADVTPAGLVHALVAHFQKEPA